MLPEKVVNLTDSFVRSYDHERPTIIEFRKTRTRVSSTLGQNRISWDFGAIIMVGQQLKIYLEERTFYIWPKLKEVLLSLNIVEYSELAHDLRLQIYSYHNPVRIKAERYLEELRKEINAPTGYTVEAASAFGNVLSKVYAEIDLFCASYSAKSKLPEQLGGTTYNVEHLHGVAGNISNSQVTLYDSSSVQKFLIDCKIPKQDRRELEDIMDDLKTASPEQKPSLLERGEKLLVKHKDALGAGAEIIGKFFGD